MRIFITLLLGGLFSGAMYVAYFHYNQVLIVWAMFLGGVTIETILLWLVIQLARFMVFEIPKRLVIWWVYSFELSSAQQKVIDAKVAHIQGMLVAAHVWLRERNFAIISALIVSMVICALAIFYLDIWIVWVFGALTFIKSTKWAWILGRGAIKEYVRRYFANTWFERVWVWCEGFIPGKVRVRYQAMKSEVTEAFLNKGERRLGRNKARRRLKRIRKISNSKNETEENNPQERINYWI